jgi:polyhydroxyalkanoate synthesis regulator phasin
MANEHKTVEDVYKATAAVADAATKVMFAGVGAVASVFDGSKDLADKLVARGEEAVEHAQTTNRELTRKVDEASQETIDALVKAHLDRLTPEERAAFVEQVSAAAAQADAASAQKTSEDTAPEA